EAAARRRPGRRRVPGHRHQPGARRDEHGDGDDHRHHALARRPGSPLTRGRGRHRWYPTGAALGMTTPNEGFVMSIATKKRIPAAALIGAAVALLAVVTAPGASAQESSHGPSHGGLP